MKSFFQPFAPVLFIALSLFTSCRTPEVVLSPGLQASPMPVKGRQGWQINQVIRYGDFSTDKVRRGWTRSYDIPFFVRFQGASEKLSYTQFGPGGMAAEVACIGKFRSKELNLFSEYFGIPLSYQNVFAGTVLFQGEQDPWDFVLHNPDGDFLRREASAGFARRGEEQLEIRAIRGMEGQPQWVRELAVYGHEFFLNGEVIGAVSTVNRGKVWIRTDLDPSIRTLVAALATGILLRRDMEEAASGG